MTRTHFNDFPMSEAQRNIAQMGIDKTKRALQAQADGLGECPDCGHEYTKAEVEGIDFDRAPTPYISECPKCHSGDERNLYYCEILPLHHESECQKFHHG